MLFYTGLGLGLVLGIGIGFVVSVLLFSKTKNHLAKALSHGNALITDFDLLCGECKKVCEKATKGFYLS